MSTFVIHALPAGEVDTTGPSTAARAAEGREPCRRCLRNAAAGDPLALASYDPFTVRSAYAGPGPVFVHADGCDAFAAFPDAVCEQVDGRVLSVRAYDADAMMIDAAVLPGERFSEHAASVLDDSRVDFLHVHFAGPGCFAFRVDRSSSPRSASRASSASSQAA